MKKILLSLLALSAVVLVACGPSATFTAIEKANADATTQLDSVTTAASIAAIMATYETAIADATTTNGELTAEEAPKAAELATALQTKAIAISDSLTQIMIQQMIATSDSTVVEETTVTVK